MYTFKLMTNRKSELQSLALVLAFTVTASITTFINPSYADDLDVSTNNNLLPFGNSSTDGDLSPQSSLIQGSLKACVGLPIKANLSSQVGLVPVSVLQDVPILSAPQNQQCTENSTQAKGDEPLSHILTQVASYIFRRSLATT